MSESEIHVEIPINEASEEITDFFLSLKARFDGSAASYAQWARTNLILAYERGYRAGYNACNDALTPTKTDPSVPITKPVAVPGLRIHGDDWKPMLKRTFPNATSTSLDWVAGAFPLSFKQYGIDTPLRAAHFLAQIGHESGELRYREEIASGAAYEGRKDLGNTQPGDGKRFKGHGLIQLTGRANHSAFSKYVRRPDIMDNPSLVASEPELALGAALWFWSAGNRTGRSLSLLADKDDLNTITRIINGGYNGLEDRRRLLGTAKRALGWAEVMLLQRMLNDVLGIELKVDGALGGMTRSAVADFQKLHGLEVDGIAGDETWAKLEKAVMETVLRPLALG